MKMNLKEIETHTLFNNWRDERDGLEECRSKEEFDRIVVRVRAVEDEIFARTGMRPPYQRGFGGIAQSW